MVSFELGKEIENDIFFVFSRAWDKEKILSLSHACDKISLLSSKLIISLIIIYKHYAIDIADPSSMQDACDMNFVTDSLTVESLWLSGRASERGIRRSEVRFLMRTQNFLSVPRSWQDEKTSFSTNYFILNCYVPISPLSIIFKHDTMLCSISLCCIRREFDPSASCESTF